MRRTVILAAALLIACGSEEEQQEQEPVCSPGELKCSGDMTAVEVCNADGTEFEVREECIQNAFCQQAICRCPPLTVPSAEGCTEVGVDACGGGMTPTETGCAMEPTACGAGEIFAGGECRFVGIQACPAERWEMELESGGCKAVEKPCGDGKHWVIGHGCTAAGLAQGCGNVEAPFPQSEVGAGVVFVLSSSDSATEDGTIENPYKSLAAAVAGSPEGSTLVLGTGDYAGGVLVDKPMRIIGKCAEYVTIVGGQEYTPVGSALPVRYAIYVSGGAAVELAGFTIADEVEEGMDATNGIYLEFAQSSLIHDIRFEGLSGTAVDLHKASESKLYNLDISDQHVAKGLSPYGQTAYGIYLKSSADVSITNCRFFKVQGPDIRTEKSCPQILRNHFEKRGPPGGLQPMGIWVTGCDTGLTLIEGNKFVDKMTHAVLVDGGTTEIRYNTVLGTVTDYDDNNGPAVKVVDASFLIEENLLRENQYAGINAVGGTGSILFNRVENGQPSDPGLKNGDGIILKDCDPGPVLLQGNTLVANTRNSILITSSLAQIEGNVIIDTVKSPGLNVPFGSGINVVTGSDVVVRGNVITGHNRFGIRFDNAYGTVDSNVIGSTSADDSGRCGGGILIGGSAGSVLSGGITNNLITDNYATGIMATNSAIGTISGNLVEGSRGEKGAMGIGIVLNGSTATIEYNWIRANKDSGLLLEDSDGKVEGNLVEDNGTGGKGGGLVLQNAKRSPVEIVRNTLTGNGFAGLVANNSSFEIKRNTLTGNKANKGGLAGAGVWLQNDSEGEVRTNFVRDNLLAGIVVIDYSDVTVSVNYVGETAAGKLPTPSGVPLEMANGVVVAAESFASVLLNRVQNNAGTGISYFDSSGILSGNVIVENLGWGVELVDSQIEIKENYFFGNPDGEFAAASDSTGPEKNTEDWAPCLGE